MISSQVRSNAVPVYGDDPSLNDDDDGEIIQLSSRIRRLSYGRPKIAVECAVVVGTVPYGGSFMRLGRIDGAHPIRRCGAGVGTLPVKGEEQGDGRGREKVRSRKCYFGRVQGPTEE